MAVTLGQVSTIGKALSATTQGTTFGVNPAAGNKIILGLEANVLNTNLSITDNGVTPATWVLDASQETAGKHVFLYRADSITLPATGQLTVTMSYVDATAHTVVIGAMEVIGAAAGGPIATNSSSATSTAVSSGATTGKAASCLYAGSFSDASGLNPETITYTGPGTEVLRNTDGVNEWPWALAQVVVNGTQSAQTFTWTLGDSVSWCACTAVYAADSSPRSQVVNLQALNRASRW